MMLLARRVSTEETDECANGGGYSSGTARGRANADVLLSLERTFYSSLNFLGTLGLVAVGLTAVGRGGKAPIVFGSVAYALTVCAAIELAMLHKKRCDLCTRSDFDGKLDAGDSKIVVCAYAGLVVVTCTMDLVYCVLFPLLDRSQAVSLSE